MFTGTRNPEVHQRGKGPNWWFRLVVALVLLMAALLLSTMLTVGAWTAGRLHAKGRPMASRSLAAHKQ